MSAKDYIEKDYYKVLGVPKDASQAQIKKAFRKIARENHPDQHPGDTKAEQRFKEASEANDILSDPDKRKEYDEMHAMGASGVRFNPGAGGASSVNVEDLFGSGGLGDIFGSMFNSGGTTTFRTSTRGQTARRGADVESSATISFVDAVEGTTVSVALVSDEPCPVCHGTGAKAGTMPHVCPDCQGSGVQLSGGLMGGTEPCHTCHGRGMIVDDPCPACNGSGRAKSNKTTQIRIPAGVADGQRIRIKGKGSPGEYGGPPGDLYIRVNVRPHPIFGRDGNNLTVRVPVTFSEASLGADIEVPTLGGPTVKLRVAPGTPNGRVFRVRGKGVSKSNGDRGDLLVTVEVVVPMTLTPEATEALQTFQKLAAEPNPRTDLIKSAS